MAPIEEVREATARLDQLETVPESASSSVTALLTRIRGIVLEEGTDQQWRDLVESANSADPSKASEVAELIRALQAAPNTPLPPNGWLFADLAALDLARAVNSSPEAPPVEQ
ncbi:hypothetical protein [Actinopolyspora saharensis]|uniref:hypothetical protein n=1 Tax=Actinopolyspora saharensis TaxID=995062 RepID=UPI003F6638D1